MGKKIKIKIKPENEGKLHEDLNVPEGKEMPAKRLATAKKSADPAEKKRIVFAQNAKKWKH